MPSASRGGSFDIAPQFDEVILPPLRIRTMDAVERLFVSIDEDDAIAWVGICMDRMPKRDGGRRVEHFSVEIDDARVDAAGDDDVGRLLLEGDGKSLLHAIAVEVVGTQLGVDGEVMPQV